MNTRDKVRMFVECGISQTKIADIAGINKSTLTKYMNGTRETITDETQAALDAALYDIANRLYNAVNEGETSGFKYDDIQLD
jgi:transcriptional regulator with XRE-family HTH domain